jgi:hypothetical protein
MNLYPVGMSQRQQVFVLGYWDSVVDVAVSAANCEDCEGAVELEVEAVTTELVDNVKV